ncbi:BA14K family protein [Chelativorans sp. ZYF759]|nr:BA14K family protein [Chelativorans sp. ZYF759]
MKTAITSFACAAGLALGLAAIAPAHAAGPASAMSQARAALAPAVSSAHIIQVQDGDFGHRYRHLDRRNRHWRGSRQYHHRRHYSPGPGFYFQFGTPRHYGPPPRHYAPPPRHAYRLPVAHVRWCQNRYRSYRVSDNSFQPYNGPRRQCRSPYY